MSSSKKTVLVVDDEPDVRMYLTTLLEDNGFIATSASDGDEAMRKIGQAPPDLITLDISMPEKGGVRLYAELQEDENLSSIPVIIVTGVSGDPDWLQSAYPQLPSPAGYLAKPIDQQQMIELARRLTD